MISIKVMSLYHFNVTNNHATFTANHISTRLFKHLFCLTIYFWWLPDK